MKPVPPVASPSGGVPAYLVTGAVMSKSGLEACTAARFGGEFAATPMQIKMISRLIQTAKFASQPKRWRVRIWPTTIPAAMKITKQTMKQMVDFEI